MLFSPPPQVKVSSEQTNRDVEPSRTTRAGKPKRVCRECGKPGHNRKTCPAINSDTDNDDDEDFVLTTGIKNEIKQYLSEGMGSREIAETYSISLKQANQAIAETKGIKLPN